jgi:hypothetical protein
MHSWGDFGGPVRFRQSLNSDGISAAVVREAYTGPDGLIEHNAHIHEARHKLFKDYADRRTNARDI